MVPNSAQDHMFVDEHRVAGKFADARPLRVLYLSSMTPPKGYLDLMEAWLRIGHDVRSRLRLDFAGRFDADADRLTFLSRIAGVEGVQYHGLVNEEQKRCLFAQAHVFCLPTRMFEGQPISILEAYASGCVVVTTGQSGIRDVFADGVNGFEVLDGSVESIAAVLSTISGEPDRLREMAVTNRRTAGERYRESMFTESVSRVLEGRSA
jgi:glycosyltransferase involved in cell wall biosynthesis